MRPLNTRRSLFGTDVRKRPSRDFSPELIGVRHNLLERDLVDLTVVAPVVAAGLIGTRFFVEWART